MDLNHRITSGRIHYASHTHLEGYCDQLFEAFQAYALKANARIDHLEGVVDALITVALSTDEEPREQLRLRLVAGGEA
jgi:hypothetical protein